MPIINKPIRLIELFAGIGSQAQALKNIGAEFEHHRVVEFDKYPLASYNAIHGTNFTPMDITKTKGEDLGIEDKEKWCYLMTYSFPCQDLSNAGKGAGMKRGSGTRSGLLWEVERILRECAELGALPDILLMENVPQVHGKKNMADFEEWLAVLEELGYYNIWQDLNAKDLGVAQNRNRCFCVSILGGKEGDYAFPKAVPLTKCMGDYLDEIVDEKYYVNNERAQALIDKLIASGQLDEFEGVGYFTTADGKTADLEALGYADK